MNQENISIEELENLMKEAEIEHAKYEKQIGHKNDDWPVWYAKYIIKKTYDI